MSISVARCKRKLAFLWFTGSGILFLVVILQTMFGRFGKQSGEAWSWLLPTIIPALSLMLGVFVIDALGKGIERKTVDRFLFRLTYSLSAVYLVLIALTIFIRPFTSFSPIELMKQSNFWLGPLQGIVTASLGVFFVKKEDVSPNEEKEVPAKS